MDIIGTGKEEDGGMKPGRQEQEAALRARQERRIQMVAIVVLGLAVLSVIIPLGVWLTRGALGLW